jgi:hypothetical protein
MPIGELRCAILCDPAVSHNCVTRRRLWLANMYWEFESTPLRHTVWTAEKLRRIALRIARNRPNSAIRTLKLD